jgi:hypothetical protein
MIERSVAQVGPAFADVGDEGEVYRSTLPLVG